MRSTNKEEIETAIVWFTILELCVVLRGFVRIVLDFQNATTTCVGLLQGVPGRADLFRVEIGQIDLQLRTKRVVRDTETAR